MNTFKKLKFLLKYRSLNPKRIDGVDCQTWRDINISKDGLFLKANADRIVFEMYIQAHLMKDINGTYINNEKMTYTAVEMAISATTFLYGESFKLVLMDAWNKRKLILEGR